MHWTTHQTQLRKCYHVSKLIRTKCSVGALITRLFGSSFSYNSKIPDRKPSVVLENISNKFNEFSIDNIEEHSPDENNIESAYDFAINLRKDAKNDSVENPEVEQPDKAVLRFLKSSIISKPSSDKLAKIIRKNIIYADSKLVIFNKPYGIASHGGDKIEANVKEVLPMVSKMLHGIKTEYPLYLCHRLGRNVSGVMVCSQNEKYAKKLVKLFREQQILKCFWAVTLNQPVPPIGKIDIPLIIKSIPKTNRNPLFSKVRCSPYTRFDENLHKEVPYKSWKGTPSTTYYRTLSTNGHVSLIEFQPKSNFKHQVRVHSAEGLSCPILGDHKYSHSDTLRPQLLSKYILDRLKIPQTKSRYMPMHLHLRKILIPYANDRKDRPHLCIIAKVPPVFDRTLKVLQLNQNTFRLPDKWFEKDQIDQKNLAPPAKTDPHFQELYSDPTQKPPASKKEENFVVVYKPQNYIKYDT